MGKPVAFAGTNSQLLPPPGDEETIQPLPVFRNGQVCVSCWELDEEELAEVIRTKKIFLTVWAGESQPPVYLGSEASTRPLVVDTGRLWDRTH